MVKRLELARRVLVALISLAALVHPAGAAVMKSKDRIANDGNLFVISRFPLTNGEPPPVLSTNRDVYVIIRASGAYDDVSVLADPRVSASALAGTLDQSIRGTTLASHNVYWSQDIYAGTLVGERSPHFGSLQVHTTVPGAIDAGLTAAGYRPHVVLISPN